MYTCFPLRKKTVKVIISKRKDKNPISAVKEKILIGGQSCDEVTHIRPISHHHQPKPFAEYVRQ